MFVLVYKRSLIQIEFSIMSENTFAAFRNRLGFTLANFYFIILAILLIFEIKLFTTWRANFDPHQLVYYFFGVQLLISILPLILIKNKAITMANAWQWTRSIPLSITAFFGLFYGFRLLKPLFDSVPIRSNESDIIPQIQRFCKEMVAGRFPYTPFDDFGWHMTPTYLPAQWLPYLPIEFTKIDPRVITFSIFALVFLFFALKITQNGVSFLKGLFLLAMPIFLISVTLDKDPHVWSITVEQLIMAYYLLLGISLTTASRGFQISAIVLCLMSRFSLIFWLPLYVFMLWTKEGTRPTIKFCAWIAAGCALIYGPFLLHDPHIFSNAQAYYDLATVASWESSDKPDALYHGFAFSIYFFEASANKAFQIALLKKYLFIITPSVSVLLGLIWWKFKDKLDFSLFALCTLKISLGVFYSLMTIPYSYLYVTPIIMSLAILYRVSVLQRASCRLLSAQSVFKAL